MPGNVFVGRQPELHRLEQFVATATGTSGRQTPIVFVAGEAGAGKSALVNEFVRRAHASRADDHLIAVIGECNAQTGAGDPYLPFRQLLTALTTGSGAATLDAGARAAERAPERAPGTKNVSRLQEFVRISGETLIDLGPDLVNIFVPGASFVAKVALRAARLGKLAERIGVAGQPVAGQPADSSPTATTASATLDQEKLFEQYTAVIKALARERTLILVLDDLQWADSGSLNLLFHLARELKDSRVLLIGTYRPDDVAIGRGDERHPLEPVLNELRRYYGDIVIDLSRSAAGEGRAFVDALVDAEPNHLDASFRQELYARTDGQPLFTVELLRHLQERGDLVKDASGRWTPGPVLNWGALPARVEGVIQERLARLPAELRETLTIGSVMGYDFIAQIIARVQQVPERELIRRLSRELDKRYRLVHETGEVQLGTAVGTALGTAFLSQYRFAHIVFQQFLYNELSAGERRLLHADVAEALETLYAGRTDDIVVQLAHHYLAAGEDEKAAAYLIRAGEAAAKVYAFPEARANYERALEAATRAHQSTLEWQSMLSLGLLWSGRDYEQAGAWLRKALDLAERLTDPTLRARSLNRLGNWLLNRGRIQEGLETLQEALHLFEAQHNMQGMAETLDELGMAQSFAGDLASAVKDYMGRAIELFRTLGDSRRLFSMLAGRAMDCAPETLETSFSALRTREECMQDVEEALRLARQTNSPSGQAFVEMVTTLVLSSFGEFGPALVHAQEALRIATAIGHREWIVASQSAVGQLYLLMLAPALAVSALEAGLEGTRTLGAPIWVGTLTSYLVLAYIRRQDYARAEAALRAVLPREHRPGNLHERQVARAWGELALAQGEPAVALRIAEQLIASAPGAVQQPIPHLLALKGEALLALQRLEEAAEALEEAKRGAQQRQAPSILWRIQRSLGRVYHLLQREDQAQGEYRAAQQVIAALAATLDDTALREDFLRTALASLP